MGFSFDLTGRTALVTGASSGLGTRFGRILAASGAKVALGARRASAVQDFLISQGVAPNRMRTVSYGKERPIEVCSDEACYQQNRRAVTVLSMGAGV